MLFVFDLDFTIWDCGGTWCDHTQPPYKLLKNRTIEDSEGRIISLYPDTLAVLNELKEKQILIATASRTGAPAWAQKLLGLFDIGHYFSYKEIYPGSKIAHFNSLKRKTGFNYNEMYFFDDEYRNIDDVGTLGVNCFLVENGLTMKHLQNIFC